MNYYARIKYLYPDIKDNEFSLIQNAFDETVIEKWEYSSALQPDIATLNAVPEDVAIKALKAILIREQRNYLLQQSDWTQLADIPLQNKAAWKIYRQQLRDLPNAENFDPENFTWPVKPQ